MDDDKLEQKLQQLLKQDLSAGTESFRDALLARCLDELGADEDGSELDDEALDLLAAAGDAFANADDAWPFGELNN